MRHPPSTVRSRHLSARRGFTTLDTLFFLAVLGGASAAAAWNLVSAYQGSNELAAMTTLSLIDQAQKEFKKQVYEFGSLQELNGSVAPGSEAKPFKSLLPKELRLVSESTALSRGYLFRIYIPLKSSPEKATGNNEKSIAAREHWCAYAWPLRFGWTGRRAFFIHDTGNLYTTTSPALSGKDPEKLGLATAFQRREPFGDVETSQWIPIVTPGDF